MEKGNNSPAPVVSPEAASGEDTSQEIFNPEARTPQEILNQKLGSKVNNIVINSIGKDDIEKAVGMAVNERLKEKSTLSKTIQAALPAAGIVMGAVSHVPLVGTALSIAGGTIANSIRSAFYTQKAYNAIQKSGDLSAAYEVLGVSKKNNVYGEDSSSETSERARMIIDRANQTSEQGADNINYGDITGLLKGESIKKLESAGKVNSLLVDYYDSLKTAGSDDAKKQEAKQQFEDNLQKLQDEGEFGQTAKNTWDHPAVRFLVGVRSERGIQNLDNIKTLADSIESLTEHDIAKEDLKKYLDDNMTLYNASMKNGINTKQQIDSVAKGVLRSGIGAGALLAAKDIAIKVGARGELRKYLASAPALGAVMGAVTGGMRGYEQAKTKLSNSEINDIIDDEAIMTDEEVADQKSVAAEDTENIQPQSAEAAVNSANQPKSTKFNVLAGVDKLKKMYTKEEMFLKQINDTRDRVSAKSLYDQLGKLMDGEQDDASKAKLREVMAEIAARNQVSDDQNIDLITFSKGNVAKERRLLMERVWQAEALIGGKPTDDEIAKFTENLTEKQAQAKELEKVFKQRQVVAEAVQGALTGAAFGYIAQKASEFMKSEQGQGLVNEAKNKVEGVKEKLGLTTAGGVASGVTESERGLNNTGNNIDVTTPISPEEMEKIKASGAPILIENDPEGGVAIGIDLDGDGKIDVNEYLHGDGEGVGMGIDLTDDKQYDNLKNELLEKYNLDLQREAISVNNYRETNIGEYLDKAENTVDNSGGVDWGRSGNRASFGMPVVAAGADGMDTYEVPVWGTNGNALPDGTKFYIDLDGNGPGKALEYTIENGKAIIPADVLDTSRVGEGGIASFIGTARVGQMDGNTMISYATSTGARADLDTTLLAEGSGTGYAFTVVGEDGEKLSQFAVDSNNNKISNLSEIFKGIPVGDSDRLPSVFAVNDLDGETNEIVLANGQKVPELDYRGGYHEEFDSFENHPFVKKNTYLGTPIEWDLDGDGNFSDHEQGVYLRQLLVKTGTDPFVLGQNASNYGILEKDNLEEIIPADVLKEWQIEDGVVDSEADLNILLDKIKLPENAKYYDGLVNATINKMGDSLQGGSFKAVTVADRISTYANSRGDLDSCPSGSSHTAILATNVNGDPVGNEGWWARKYGAEGGLVYQMTDCDQICVERKTTSEKTTGEKTTEEKTTNEKTTEEKTTNEKTTEEKTTNEKTTEEKTTNEKTTEEKTTSEKTTSEKTTSEKATSEKTTSEGTAHTPKDVNAEIEHAGDHVTPMGIDNETTPPTTLQQDQAGFEELDERRAADAARAAEAERIRIEQAEAQRLAAEQAAKEQAARDAAEAERLAQMEERERIAAEAREVEARRQAEEAARRAEEQAAEAQRAAAEAEARRAAEEAAREAAQAEADARDAIERAAAEAGADASASDRARLFESLMNGGNQ